MCFSAEASFTAAAVLGVCGAYLVNKFKNDNRKIFLAMIPCFFALQQFCEGLLWVAFNHNEYGTTWSYVAQYGFMFFAYLFWPVWIPIAYLFSEKVEWRRYVMTATLMVGMAFYCYIVFQYFTSPIHEAHVVKNSIVYVAGSQLSKIFYVAIVLVPIFVSSIPRMGIIGILTAVSFFTADYVYNYAYTSIWCFASAIVFTGLYFVLKSENEDSSSDFNRIG